MELGARQRSENGYCDPLLYPQLPVRTGGCHPTRAGAADSEAVDDLDGRFAASPASTDFLGSGRGGGALPVVSDGMRSHG